MKLYSCISGSILLCLLTVAAVMPPAGAQDAAGLRVATFDMDVTPPIGSMMAYDAVKGTWDMGLRARGIVLLGAEEPIVLCAIDWIGISNGSHDAFRETLAKAAGTTPQRVTVHSLHQHDAPMTDFSTEQVLKDHGHDDLGPVEGTFQREVIARLGETVAASLEKTTPVTHVGKGSAEVFKVASNRRILDENNKVRAMRFTTCTDPKIAALPEGTIDPMVSVVSLWNKDKPVAVLSYYAIHPQSYYRTGIPNPDFPGVARFLRQLAVPDALHVHFTGPGANLGAGKYNDGSHENRMILAERLADGMRRAWESTEKEALTADNVGWAVARVSLQPGTHLSEEGLEAILQDKGKEKEHDAAARNLVWLRRCQEGRQIEIPCLALGNARIIHMPGELFVEYQLAAKAMRPDYFVAMAAYADYAPGYIGTTVAYDEGGYETSSSASRVASNAETILMAAISNLLEK